MEGRSCDADCVGDEGHVSAGGDASGVVTSERENSTGRIPSSLMRTSPETLFQLHLVVLSQVRCPYRSPTLRLSVNGPH